MDRAHARLVKRARALEAERANTSLDAFMDAPWRGASTALWALAGLGATVGLLVFELPLLAASTAAVTGGVPFLAFRSWRRHARTRRPVTGLAKTSAEDVAAVLEGLDALPAGPERDALREAAVLVLEEVFVSGPVLFEAADREPALVMARHAALREVVLELEAAAASLEAAAKNDHQALALKHELDATGARLARLREVATSARAGSDALEQVSSSALAEVIAVSTQVRATATRPASELA